MGPQSVFKICKIISTTLNAHYTEFIGKSTFITNNLSLGICMIKHTLRAGAMGLSYNGFVLYEAGVA